MSAFPLHNFEEWHGLNAFHCSDQSYDVVGYQNVEDSDFNAAQRYDPTQPDDVVDYIVSSSTIPEVTPYDYYDDPVPPSQRLPPIDRDFDITYPETYAMSTNGLGEQNSHAYYPLGQANVYAEDHIPEQYPPHEEHMYHPDLDSTQMDLRWIELQRNELLYHAPRGISAPSNGLSACQPEATAQPAYSPARSSGRPGPSRIEVNNLVQADDSRIIDINGRRIKQQQCPICQKWFEAKPSNLQRHMDIHSGTKRYKCRVCQKEWVTKDQVIVHCIKHHMKVELGRSPKDERNEAKNYVERV